MKKIMFISFLSLLLVISCTQELKVADWLKVGTKFTYGVDYQGKEYDFIVEITQLEPDLIYNWEMTDPVNLEGKMTIQKEALESSFIHRNYYFGGEYETNEETSGWFSRKSFSELKNQGYTLIQAGYGTDTLKVEMKMVDTIEVSLNEKTKKLNIIYAETEDGYAYWILDSKQYPVILKMHVDFNIDIDKIEY